MKIKEVINIIENDSSIQKEELLKLLNKIDDPERIHSFITLDRKYQYSVKNEFLKRCPNLEIVDEKTFFCNYDGSEYLHNDNGPAVVRLFDKFKMYWVDGNYIRSER